MKVTVCFGNVRVVVPCGDGDLLVRDLIREATLRYKKATGKGADSWVAVHNLQSQSGGGILDPDDRLNDVADDREQIIANFEDGDGVHHGGGDGASGSSVGTGSPDIFHDSDHKYGTSYSRTDIEVTGEQIASGLIAVPLQVRRGSEPNLNQLPPSSVEPGPRPPDPTKRWSAAPIILGDLDAGEHKMSNGRPLHHNGYLSPDWTREDDKDEEDDDDIPFQRIARDGSNRLSMQFLGDCAGGYRWADAAERATSKHRNGSTSLPRDHRRKEPLGQANNSTSPVPTTPSSLLNRLSPPECDDEENVELIVIRNEPGPLGIHVVPDYDRLGKDRGLVVQGIEPGGRIDRDGKLAIYDRIIEINGQNLLNMPFQRVQEMFKLSLIATELRLKVIKHKQTSEQFRKPPAPVYPMAGQVRRFPEDKENVAMVEAEEQLSTNTKVATVSPTKKIPGGSRNLKSLLTANTRKIGKKIELELTKGVHGLGFSITTRDNPAGGNCPIYIKNILPKGAAVEDGRLKPGDRLLEVNGIEMTGKSQAEAVAVLRNAPPGSRVKIVVSRQEDVTGPQLPRELGADGSDSGKMTPRSISPNPTPPAIPPLPANHDLSKLTPERKGSVAKIISQFQEAAKNSSNVHEKTNDDSLVFPWKHREILTFDIPVHDSEKAGLGVSVKGKTTNSANGSGSTDLGIFVKSVLHGGAASRDKRLRTNDQLLNVNGISLLQQSNSEAMETLRRAMLHTEGPVKGSITLTIARRASSPAPVSSNHSDRSTSSHLTNSSGPDTVANMNLENENSTDNSGTSESSGNTVIFLPYKQGDCSVQSLNSSNQSMSKNLSTSWNPVIDRITGQSKTHNQLRNESYYMATHDTWSTSMLMGGKPSDKLSSPTVNLPSGETVIIEEEYPPNVPLTNSRNRIGDGGAIENRNDIEPDGKASIASSICDKTTESSNPPSANDATYASQLSLENPAGFSRDAFGRQSMSEKRHATLDAKNTGTYQRNKKLREERDKLKPKDANTNLVRVGSVESVISLNRSPIQHPEYADKLGELGPSLGMKKSSSLESLQTMVQEIQMQEEGDPAYSYRGGQGALKVIRGRGCDESFRAAVDVDYNKHLVDPDHRAETSAKKHWLLDPPAGRPNTETNEREIDGFNNVRGGVRQSSLNAVLDGKHKQGKKKPGILRGIGSMFRFGKHRKMDSTTGLDQLAEPAEFEPEAVQEQPKDQVQVNKEMEKQQVQEEQRREEQRREEQRRDEQRREEQRRDEQRREEQRREEQRREEQRRDEQRREEQRREEQRREEQRREDQRREDQRREEQRREQQQEQYQPPHQHHSSQHQHQQRQRQRQMEHHHHSMIPEGAVVSSSSKYHRDGDNSGAVSRSERVHNLRSQHQQRHAERQGHYPCDEREEHYEEVIRQRLEHAGGNYEGYREMVRPGSRSGIADPVRFNHYVNYDELQHHLSRKQHQYHSQRQPRSELHQRPVSNFYEYESVQSLIHGRGRQMLPVISPQQNGDLNSNSLPRHQPPVVGRNVFTQQHARPYQQPPVASPPYQRYVAVHNQRNQHSSSAQHSVNGKLRGPFVTHVTIGTDGNKNTGSKV